MSSTYMFSTQQHLINICLGHLVWFITMLILHTASNIFHRPSCWIHYNICFTRCRIVFEQDCMVHRAYVMVRETCLNLTKYIIWAIAHDLHCAEHGLVRFKFCNGWALGRTKLTTVKKQTCKRVFWTNIVPKHNVSTGVASNKSIFAKYSWNVAELHVEVHQEMLVATSSYCLPTQMFLSVSRPSSNHRAKKKTRQARDSYKSRVAICSVPM